MAPKDASFLISWTCEYVTLQGKWNFENVITVKDLEMGGYPRLLQSKDVSPWKLEFFPAGSERDARMEARSETQREKDLTLHCWLGRWRKAAAN